MAPKRKLDLTITAEFMAELKSDSFYSSIDIDLQAGMCERHHKVNGSNYNKRSLVKWLNNAVAWKRERERPLVNSSLSSGSFGMTTKELAQLKREIAIERAKEVERGEG